MKDAVTSTIKVIGLALIVISMGVFHVWLRTKVVTVGYRVSEKRLQISELEDQISKAKLERSRLFSAENLERHVERFAQQGLHFSEPEAEQLMYRR